MPLRGRGRHKRKDISQPGGRCEQRTVNACQARKQFELITIIRSSCGQNKRKECFKHPPLPAHHT
eukprot:1156184-Pelagomonas_calceolata.AAC.7